MDLVLLELLACPVCGGKLLYDQQDQQLFCRLDRLTFPIQQGVPIMKTTQLSHTEQGGL